MHGKKQETNGLYVQLQGAFLPSSCFSVLLPKHMRPEFQVHQSHHNVLTRTFRLLYIYVSVSYHTQHEKGLSQQRAASLEIKAV